jgi:hypothetical protein
MRNPQAKVWIYLLLAALGIAAVVYGFEPHQRLGVDRVKTGLAIGGMIVMPIALVQLATALLLASGRSKLQAGTDLLARWLVTPAEWERFRAFDRIRAAAAPGLANDIVYDDERPERAIEVRVGKHSVQVGDSYHVLRPWGIPGLQQIYWLPAPADPECLEFHVIYPRRYGAGLRLAVRFPVSPAARADAVRVYEYFAPRLVRRPSLAMRNPPKTIVISLIVAFFAASGAWLGFARAKVGDGTDIGPLMAAIVGSITAPAALLVALLTIIMSRRRA